MVDSLANAWYLTVMDSQRSPMTLVIYRAHLEEAHPEMRFINKPTICAEKCQCQAQLSAFTDKIDLFECSTGKKWNSSPLKVMHESKHRRSWYSLRFVFCDCIPIGNLSLGFPFVFPDIAPIAKQHSFRINLKSAWTRTWTATWELTGTLAKSQSLISSTSRYGEAASWQKFPLFRGGRLSSALSEQSTPTPASNNKKSPWPTQRRAWAGSSL